MRSSFFKEPLLDPLPDNSQTKGFKGNPGLITDTLVLKRLQPDYAKIGIPRFGDLQQTESLNVATATAIILSEFKRFV